MSIPTPYWILLFQTTGDVSLIDSFKISFGVGPRLTFPNFVEAKVQIRNH